jgi:hypothetical protein
LQQDHEAAAGLIFRHTNLKSNVQSGVAVAGLAMAYVKTGNDGSSGLLVGGSRPDRGPRRGSHRRRRSAVVIEPGKQEQAPHFQRIARTSPAAPFPTGPVGGAGRTLLGAAHPLQTRNSPKNKSPSASKQQIGFGDPARAQRTELSSQDLQLSGKAYDVRPDQE